MEASAIAMMIPIVAILASLGVIAAIVLTENHSRRQRVKLLHEERMLALEKGLPVPMDYSLGRQRRPYAAGMVWLAIGLGFIFLSMYAADGSDSREMTGVGAIPVLIGCAILLTDRWELKRAEQKSKAIEPYLEPAPSRQAADNRS